MQTGLISKTRSGGAPDVGAMIEGMRRWVEIESPTYDSAAVNRVMDVVMDDVRNLSLQVERIAGRKGFGDTLAVRTDRAGTAGAHYRAATVSAKRLKPTQREGRKRVCRQ